MDNTLELSKILIQQASVTPEDAGCQPYLAELLTALGFQVESLPFADVSNLWARIGTQAPLLVFAGHTDVVPPGDSSAWHSPPFTATIRDGYCMAVVRLI